jgi:cytochrome P450
MERLPSRSGAAGHPIPGPRCRFGSLPGSFPIGASTTLEDLETPYLLLARLRDEEPVSWLDVLEGWLVTRHDLAVQVMHDADTFTVDDPRFSTGRVVGPSMLTLEGEEHGRHRAPFVGPFRLQPVRERFTDVVAGETDRLIDAIEPAGDAELRRSFAGPLAAAVVMHALGLQGTAPDVVLGWYDAIVDAVTEVTKGNPLPDGGRRAWEDLSAAMVPALEGEAAASLLAAAAHEAAGLDRAQVLSNAGVMLFGGIETTEGMIANVVAHLLAHPDQRALVEADPGLLPGAVEESLRLEPAAAVLDRYATRDAELGGASIAGGDLVRISVTGANRDPAVFPDPDRFDVRRPNASRHITFARGPHVCIGMHLARLEAHTAVGRLLARLPGLRLDADRTTPPAGLVFRKPAELHVRWDAR